MLSRITVKNVNLLDSSERFFDEFVFGFFVFGLDGPEQNPSPVFEPPRLHVFRGIRCDDEMRILFFGLRVFTVENNPKVDGVNAA